MKNLKFKYVVVISLLFAIAVSECAPKHKSCRAMRFYKRDVRAGRAS